MVAPLLLNSPSVTFTLARLQSAATSLGLSERKGSLTSSYIYIRGEFGTIKDPGQCV